YLGDGFAKVLDIQFLDQDGVHKHVHQTSWGLSTRVIGALIMVHGDERGLVLPPRVAPFQVIIVPIAPEPRRDEVFQAARDLAGQLADKGIRVHVDDRPEHTPGWKFNEWELRGVPLRLEIGPRDLDAGTVVLVRRDTGQKETVNMAEAVDSMPDRLDQLQAAIYAKAKAFLEEHTHFVTRRDQLAELVRARAGMLLAPWCGADQCELAVKEETGATIRCIPDKGSEPEAGDRCVQCGQAARHRVYFARAY